MLDATRTETQAWLRRTLERAVSGRVLRWTWNEIGDSAFPVSLDEFRPADIDSVPEMVAGRYLWSGKLVDSDGASPFALKISHRDWRTELHEFAWLRHFSVVADEDHRRFARTLVLDWIARYGQFDAETWALGLTARRVMNWLRHLPLLFENIAPAQARQIRRTLVRQLRSLRFRARFAADPVDVLMVEIATLGGLLCQGGTQEAIAERVSALEAELARQIDTEGLHKSRSPAIQVQILSELVTLRVALAKPSAAPQNALGDVIARMHAAIAQLTLGTGELGYFNGSGQQQVDLIYALQARGGAQSVRTGTLSGYGILRSGGAVVIADSGLIPERSFSRQAHAGALAFEFSHGSELIIGNCGPAPAELMAQAHLFRLSAAHSAPSIGHTSAATLVRHGSDAGMMLANGEPPELELDREDGSMKLLHHGYERRFGVTAERWLTLMADGNTLVGQDRYIAPAPQSAPASAPVTLRFHLGPGAVARREADEDIIHVRLPSGAEWSFLWEGAEAALEESVRQSAYFGFYRTTQIVLETGLEDGAEIAWILTRLA